MRICIRDGKNNCNNILVHLSYGLRKLISLSSLNLYFAVLGRSIMKQILWTICIKFQRRKWSKSFHRQLELKGARSTVSDELVHSKSPQNAYSIKISLRAHCFTIQINSSCAMLFAITPGRIRSNSKCI